MISIKDSVHTASFSLRHLRQPLGSQALCCLLVGGRNLRPTSVVMHSSRSAAEKVVPNLLYPTNLDFIKLRVRKSLTLRIC